jgi:hypothetical protein
MKTRPKFQYIVSKWQMTQFQVHCNIAATPNSVACQSHLEGNAFALFLRVATRGVEDAAGTDNMSGTIHSLPAF